MADFQIEGTRYKSGPLDGVAKILLTKRLMPVALALGAAIPEFALASAVPDQVEAEDDDGQELRHQAMSMLAGAMLPAARELAAMRDDDVKYVLDICMGVTERTLDDGVGWAPVVQRGIIQHPGDQKFATHLTIAWHVIAENFGEVCRSLGIDITAVAAGAQRSLAGRAGNA